MADNAHDHWFYSIIPLGNLVVGWGRLQGSLRVDLYLVICKINVTLIVSSFSNPLETGHAHVSTKRVFIYYFYFIRAHLCFICVYLWITLALLPMDLLHFKSP